MQGNMPFTLYLEVSECLGDPCQGRAVALLEPLTGPLAVFQSSSASARDPDGHQNTCVYIPVDRPTGIDGLAKKCIELYRTTRPARYLVVKSVSSSFSKHSSVVHRCLLVLLFCLSTRHKMRFPWLAVVACLGIDGAHGLSVASQSTEPTSRSVFADVDLPSVWSASIFQQLRARAVSTSGSSLHSRDESLPALLSNVTEPQLRKAREIVEKAVEEAAVRNRKRLDNPLRNNYRLQDGTKIYSRDEAPALLPITDEIADAAALVAEADVFGDNFELTNGSTFVRPETRQSKGFWMEDMKHQGAWPWGKNEADFKVFRNVKDYGAKGDGKTVSSILCHDTAIGCIYLNASL